MARLNEQISGLGGKNVRLGRGEPGGGKGNLVGIKKDYLTLYTEDGTLVHYPLQHLKSITEISDAAKYPIAPDEAISREIASLPGTFWELVKTHHGRKIKVYDHGPESATGLLFECGDDFMKLVTSPDEMVHYSAFHIRSLSLVKPKSKDDKDGKGKTEGKSNDDGKGKDN